MTSVHVGVRAELTEVDPVLHTEDPLGLLVDHTLILLRNQVLHEAGLFGVGHQLLQNNVSTEVLQNNIGFEVLPLGSFPTRRTMT